MCSHVIFKHHHFIYINHITARVKAGLINQHDWLLMQPLKNSRHIHHMVVVAMRQQDRGARSTGPSEIESDLGRFGTRVDDDRLGRGPVGANEIAIRPDLAERELVNGERHGRMSLSLTSVQTWDLMEIEAPAGTRDPVVVHSGNEARAVLIVLNAGQVMGDHQVKENAWVTVLDGRVQITAGGESVDAGPGMLCRFDPDERHSLASAEGARILLLLAPWPGEGHFRGS